MTNNVQFAPTPAPNVASVQPTLPNTQYEFKQPKAFLKLRGNALMNAINTGKRIEVEIDEE